MVHPLERAVALVFLFAVALIAGDVWKDSRVDFQSTPRSLDADANRWWPGAKGARGYLELDLQDPDQPVLGADFTGQAFYDCDLARFVEQHAEVQWFLLGEKQVSNSGLLVLESCPNLTLLGLRSLPINQDGLSQVVEARSLTELDMSSMPIRDGMLKSLESPRGLRRLHLRNTVLTDASLRELYQFDQL